MFKFFFIIMGFIMLSGCDRNQAESNITSGENDRADIIDISYVSTQVSDGKTLLDYSLSTIETSIPEFEDTFSFDTNTSNHMVPVTETVNPDNASDISNAEQNISESDTTQIRMSETGPIKNISHTTEISMSIPDEDAQIDSDNKTISAAGSTLKIFDDEFKVNEDTSLKDLDLLLNDITTNGENITVIYYTQSENGGIVTQTANGLFNYAPPKDFNGNDYFSYTIANESGETATAKVNLSVVPVNDIPIAKPDSFQIDSGKENIIDVLANDTGLGDKTILSITTTPAHGKLIVINNKFSYQQNSYSASKDSFSYKIEDENGDISYADVTLSLQCLIDCKQVLSLRWDPSLSTDISSYKIYIGTEQNNFDKSIEVGNVTELEYIIESKGSYYFAVSAINFNNIESDLSQTLHINL